MAATNGAEFRDYIRVVVSRGWWFAFVTLVVVAGVLGLSFHATKTYKATNEILVTDKYAGSLPKDIAASVDWVSRMRTAEENFKRRVPAREIIQEALAATGIALGDAETGAMVDSFKDDMKLEYAKEGAFIRLSYIASDAKLAAAVLSVFIKRAVSSAVEMQVAGLNAEVEMLLELRGKLAGEVSAAERKLDEMRTFAPELRLTASTMALLKSGKDITPMLSTEQAVAVFLELQRDIIMLDSQIADTCEQMETVKKQIAGEAEVVPTQRKLEKIPAVIEATKRRDQLRLQLAQLLGNSTIRHPMVKEIQAELKSLDAYLQSATNEATVEVVYQANQRRRELESKLATLESDLSGVQQRRAKMEESARDWRKKLDAMPSELRVVREATLEYEKKADNLSKVTDSLVQAQIKRNLELDQVGTYYRPQWDVTPVPEKYDKPKHLLHLVLGLVLGLMASVFVVYAIEFTDHSVKDQRDLRFYSKAAILGVISDYNQMKAVVARTAVARAAAMRQYFLAALFIASAAVLGWASWRSWPSAQPAQALPATLSAETVTNVEQAMRLYSSEADLGQYEGGGAAGIDVAPAIEIPLGQEPQPVLSE